MTVRGFGLRFDWSQSHGYGGPLEDVTSYLTDDDLTVTTGRDTSQAASSLPAGTLGFQITEKTQPGAFQFAPEQNSGTLAGLIVPGVSATFDTTLAGATTTLFTGVLDDYTYEPDARTLTGTVRDAWGLPSAEKLSTMVYQGLRTGDLIHVVLNAIGWPLDKRSIDYGATVVPFWWEEGTDAATAIQKLVDSEGPPAIAYVEAGVFFFRDRHHRITLAASTTSQALFSSVYPPGSGPSTDFKILAGSFSYKHGRANLINTATFSVDRRTIGDLAPVWSAQSGVGVPAGQTVQITITATDPFVNAQTPIPATTFDDQGNPLTGDYVLAYGSVGSISLSRTAGQSLILTIVGGGVDAFFSFLQIRANPIPVGSTVQVTASDSGSVASKGTLTWPNQLPWAGEYDALAIARTVVSTYAVARPVLVFDIDATMTNGSGVAYMTQFVSRAISDRITVRHDLVGLSEDFFIEKIELIVRGLGKRGTVLRITAEAVPPTGAANPFRFGVAGAGFDQGQFDADGITNASNAFRFDVAGHGFDQGVWVS